MTHALLRNTRVRIGAVALAVVSATCTSVDDHYDQFLDRGDRTPPPSEEPDLCGVLADIRGDHFFNIAINALGDVKLQLRITVKTYTPDEDGKTALVTGEMRLAAAPWNSEPLATFGLSDDEAYKARIDECGRLFIRVKDVFVPADKSPIKDVAVRIEYFDLKTYVLSADTLCGYIGSRDPATGLGGGKVQEPFEIDLNRTTFGAERYIRDEVAPPDVPTRCPVEVGEPETDTGIPDAGFPDAEDDVEDPVDDNILPPVRPLGRTERANISGRYYMAADVAGIPLVFYTDIVYHEFDGKAAVDGALRANRGKYGDPATAVFTTVVDENGLFNVGVERLQASTNQGLALTADIGLRAGIKNADFFCGFAKVKVYEPALFSSINIDNATFAATRITPGTLEVPENALKKCPPEPDGSGE